MNNKWTKKDWISVKKDLPETECYMLLFDKNYGALVGYLLDDEETWEQSHTDIHLNITHWTGLPDEPDGDDPSAKDWTKLTDTNRPKYGQRVLLWDDCYGFIIGYLEHDGKTWTPEHLDRRIRPTHWMELPENPD